MEIAVGTRFIASATKRPQQTDATNGRDKSRPYGVANGATARSKMPLT